MPEIVEFTHLHVHTEYSLLDGAAPVDKLVKKAKSMNMRALAITDHGVMYGVIDFYKAAVAEGIKPIIGCEVYVAPRTRFDKQHEYDSDLSHLVLLAKDNDGYHNLIKLVSDASIEGFYYRPRVDHDLLRRYSGGLVCLSACLAGEIPKLLLAGDYAGARERALLYQDIYGKENYFIEIQDHGLDEQKRVNPMLVKLAHEIGAGLVATNDSHYIEKSDAPYQDVLMCIQMGKTVDDPDRMKFGTDEFYLKSGVQMQELFPYAPEAIANTNKIADMCNVTFDFDKTYLPHFDVPEGYDSFTYLRDLCYKGLAERYHPVTARETDRLEYELGVIRSMGYVDYFLIVWDFIKFAKDNKIPVGPGRGSGAGSIVAYSLNITTIDPLKYSLLFERFLNPERVSMPDIDTDFCIDRRGEVIDYVVRKYGADHVAQIITFGTLKARAAVRDVGRALGVPLATVDMVAKLVPNELKMTLDKALDVSNELYELYQRDETVKKLIDTARAVEGLPRHSGVHAAGVVITGEPASSYVPLQLSKDGIITTQYHMDNVSELGLLKMDFLGLRNLTVIKNAVDNIKLSRGEEVDIDHIDFERPEVYDMISAADTLGVFQLESNGMRDFIKELKPRTLEDIIAGISLFRPGPMEQIPRYIRNKNNPDKITYKHPLLEPILNVTYGCIIYQEQVLQIVQSLAGYPLGRADLLRRAMSKKKHDVMEKERQFFIYGQKDGDGNVILDGAIARGVSESVAASIFDEIMDFASYAFNKSHAAAYAIIAYQTAYLKRFYTPEYMAALLSSMMSNTTKTVEYIADCTARGISLLPPDVNKSYYRFTVEDGKIRFGLEAVKNVGHKLLLDIAQERETNGPFKSFTNFLERMSGKELNKRSLESLIKCGAFDSLGANRRQLMAVYEDLLSGITAQNRQNIAGQVSLFDDGGALGAEGDADELPNLPEFDKRELLNMEKETIGLYLSGHPLDDYREKITQYSSANTAQINELATEDENGEFTVRSDGAFQDGDLVTIGGIITGRRNKTTRSNSQMAFLTLEDLYGSIDVLVFPKVYEKVSPVMAVDSIVFLTGRVSLREDEAPKLLCERIVPYEQFIARPQTLYLKLERGREGLWDEAKAALTAHRGDTPVKVYFEQSNQVRSVSRDLFCTVNDALLADLIRIFGKNCVKVK
ncbi:MAG TPA: DNA polymerase III subunit alpha [Candidatus Aphodoplasma excrementigallinarum]|uniref:DNA polymerase III subunit alpha n=1 Tax=Candidatus Aphodoplasma excrementigallinarum TaxID=2840673 RepID=A0A9D1NFR2_9FIRM|nr:DNA polymerase III subunit alpha [Candidatus Aphodoplasma excrementigallinarum]